jgi:large subunit ribosomal protein L13
MKTTKTLKPADCNIKWYLIDATDLVLGRLASQIATIIRGKNKPCFSPSQDCGDYVVVINADKIQLTGKKLEQKEYFHHPGYIGGIHSESAKDLMQEKPERVLIKAVERMISRNSLGRQQMTKLRVFAGSEHPHAAQNPIVLDIASKNRKNKRSV